MHCNTFWHIHTLANYVLLIRILFISVRNTNRKPMDGYHRMTRSSLMMRMIFTNQQSIYSPNSHSLFIRLYFMLYYIYYNILYYNQLHFIRLPLKCFKNLTVCEMKVWKIRHIPMRLVFSACFFCLNVFLFCCYFYLGNFCN